MPDLSDGDPATDSLSWSSNGLYLLVGYSDDNFADHYSLVDSRTLKARVFPSGTQVSMMGNDIVYDDTAGLENETLGGQPASPPRLASGWIGKVGLAVTRGSSPGGIWQLGLSAVVVDGTDGSDHVMSPPAFVSFGSFVLGALDPNGHAIALVDGGSATKDIQIDVESVPTATITRIQLPNPQGGTKWGIQRVFYDQSGVLYISLVSGGQTSLYKVVGDGLTFVRPNAVLSTPNGNIQMTYDGQANATVILNGHVVDRIDGPTQAAISGLTS